MTKRWFMSIFTILSISLTLFAFNNCSPIHEGTTGGVTDLSSDLCSGVLSDFYSANILPLSTKGSPACASCHANGTGPQYLVNFNNFLDSLSTGTSSDLADRVSEAANRVVTRANQGTGGFHPAMTLSDAEATAVLDSLSTSTQEYDDCSLNQ